MNTRQLRSQLDQLRKMVDVDHFDITLGELVRMLEEGEITRAPTYQRKFRWTAKDESYLIESLFLGLPVPSIYVATNRDGTWELVDGLQRLSSIAHYMTKSASVLKELNRSQPLPLVGLLKLTLYNGLSFSDLPTPLRLQFKKRPLRVTALSDKSDVEVRFDMFERLNRGGIALTAQEVRACVFRGPFTEMLAELANLDDFKALVKLQELHQHDGTREELVLKFFAYKDRQDEFDGRVSEFLNGFAKMAASDFDIVNGRSLFAAVVAALRGIVEGPILRSRYHVTPQNQLEAILVAAGRLIASGESLATPSDGWLDDAELVRFSTKGTNTKTSLNGRIERARQLLSGES